MQNEYLSNVLEALTKIVSTYEIDIEASEKVDEIWKLSVSPEGMQKLEEFLCAINDAIDNSSFNTIYNDFEAGKIAEDSELCSLSGDLATFLDISGSWDDFEENPSTGATEDD